MVKVALVVEIEADAVQVGRLMEDATQALNSRGYVVGQAHVQRVPPPPVQRVLRQILSLPLTPEQREEVEACIRLV